MNELRVGVIGTGGFFHGVHLPCMRRVGGLRIAAAADLDAAARQQAERAIGQGVRVYADFREMLAAGGLDAVYVITRPTAMRAIVPELARAGVAIFCEKPPGQTSDDAAAMADACDAAGVIHQVAFNRRFGPFTQTLRDWLAQAAPTRIEVFFRRVFTRAPDRLVGSGIHALDLTVALMGPAVRVFSARAARRPGEGFCHFHAAIEFASGASGAFLYDNRMAVPEERYLLSAVSGDTLDVRQFELSFPPPHARRPASGVDRTHLAYREWGVEGAVFDTRHERYERPDLAAPDDLLVGGGYQGEHDAFAAAVRAGRPASPTFAETIHSMRLAEAIQAGGLHELSAAL